MADERQGLKNQIKLGTWQCSIFVRYKHMRYASPTSMLKILTSKRVLPLFSQASLKQELWSCQNFVSAGIPMLQIGLTADSLWDMNPSQVLDRPPSNYSLDGRLFFKPFVYDQCSCLAFCLPCTCHICHQCNSSMTLISWLQLLRLCRNKGRT